MCKTTLKAFAYLGWGSGSSKASSKRVSAWSLRSYPLLLAEGLQGQLILPASLTPRHCWQKTPFKGGEYTGQRGVPGSECCDNAEPATDPDPCGKCTCTYSCQPSNGQCKEGQEQESEYGNQGSTDPQRANKHQTGEDRPPQEEGTNPLAESICFDKRGSNACWRQKDETKGQPEAGIGAEGGRAKGVTCPEFLDTSDEAPTAGKMKPALELLRTNVVSAKALSPRGAGFASAGAAGSARSAAYWAIKVPTFH